MNSSDSIMRMKFRYIRWVGEGDRRDGWSDGKQAGGGWRPFTWGDGKNLTMNILS